MDTRKYVLPAPELPNSVMVYGQSRIARGRSSWNRMSFWSPMYISRIRDVSKRSRTSQ